MKARTVHPAEFIRPEDARASGLTSDVPGLGCLVVDIRKKVDAPPRHGCQQSFLETQLARRLSRRTRGDG